MFSKGSIKASIEGNKLIIETDDPKETAKFLGFQYSPEFKNDMMIMVSKYLKLKTPIPIEQMKDMLEEDNSKEGKRFKTILHEIKPQVKIEGVYYNYHVYHTGIPGMTMLELSKMHDLDEILNKKVPILPDTKQIKKIESKKKKLIQGGYHSYDTMRKYYAYNDKIEKLSK